MEAFATVFIPWHRVFAQLSVWTLEFLLHDSIGKCLIVSER